MATAFPTLSDTVDKQALEEGYITAALTEPDCGTPYQDSSVTVQRNTALNYLDRLLARSNENSITYDSFLFPQSVKDVCDGKTLYTRRTGNRNASSESYGQTAGWGSIEPLCKTLMRLMKLFGIQDDARIRAFETLIGQARKHCEAKQQKQKVPAYEDIVEQATTYIGNCDTSNLVALSEATAVALQTAFAPTREKALLCLRKCSTEDFDVKTMHSDQALAELKENIPSHKDVASLATVVFDGYTPIELHVGLHGKSPKTNKARTKNQRYAIVELYSPLFPIADELVETVQTGLKALCNDLPQGKFVFRNNTGDKPFRKSWMSETLTKAFGISKTTHGLGAAGALRKSVERYNASMVSSDEHTLEDAARIHAILQHEPATAWEKYIDSVKELTEASDDDTSDGDGDGEDDMDSPFADHAQDQHDADEEPARRRLINRPAAAASDGNDHDLELDRDDQAESGPAASSATGVTVEGYNPMLESRKEELSYTDTGNGWSMRNVIKPLPVDEVMAVLYNHYDAGATLTDEMITGIDWLYSDEANDFRRTATQEDNIPGQLLAVLNGTEMPDLDRDYPFTDMTNRPGPAADGPAADGPAAEESNGGRAINVTLNLVSDSDDDGDEPATETIFNDEFAVGPAMRALIAAFTTAYEQDRKRRRTD
jgi:hypothetical protein